MTDYSDDHLDDLLGQLGHTEPFPVDWGAYEQKLFGRLAAAERRRKRRSRLTTFAYAAASMAATVLIMSLPATPEITQHTTKDVVTGESVVLQLGVRRGPRAGTAGAIMVKLEQNKNAPVFVEFSSRSSKGRGTVRLEWGPHTGGETSFVAFLTPKSRRRNRRGN